MYSQGDRALAMGPKRDGPNWVMIAGGAIVMAVGIVIGRKQIQCQGEQSKGRPPNIGMAELSTLIDSRDSSSKGTPVAYGVAYHFDSPGMKELPEHSFSPDSSSSQLSWNAPRATTYWDDSGAPQPQLELYSSKAKRPPTKPSPPASKMCRPLAHDPMAPLPCTDEFQSGTYSSPALRAGLAARREMVQRLRQQLRSRDAIIFDMQAQIADHDQVITMHRALAADLQERLNTTSTELFKANLEVQRLRKVLGIRSAKPAVNIDDRNGHNIFDDRKQFENPDLHAIILEARRLNERVKLLEGEKQEMESQIHSFSQECEFLFRKTLGLETQVEHLKRSVNAKGHMLEAKEQECVKLTTALVNLQHKLDTEMRDGDWTRNSQASRSTEALSGNSRDTWSDHGIELPVSCNTPDDYYSRSTNIADGDSHHAGDLMRSYNTLFAQSPSKQDSDGSVSKPGSRSTAHGCTSKSGCDGSPNYDDDNDDSINPSLVWTLQQEVYQLSDALASRSKAVSQKKLETSRVLTEFQKRIVSAEGAQASETTSRPQPEGYDWADLSQVLSFSPDGTSAKQLQELSHKLEQVAKQQEVEEEIEALYRHQAKLGALKSRVTKLIVKCDTRNTKDEASKDDSAHEVAGMVLDLADKLAAQEDQVRETSMDVQQLSMSLQLSSPYVPRSKKQELRRMLQEGRSSDTVHHKDIPISPGPVSAKSSYVVQEQPFLDRQMSFSSLPHKADAAGTPSPEKPLNNLYAFQQLGAFDLLPTPKTRKCGNSGAGRSSLRKPVMHQADGIELKWDSSIDKPSAQLGTRRVCFSPDEVTNGFSFPPATKVVENPDGNEVARHSSWVVESEDFQFAHDLPEVPDRGASIVPHADSTYCCIQATTPSSHEHIDDNPASDDKLSPAGQIGSPANSGSVTAACFESRDSGANLRRLLFRPENITPLGGNSACTSEDTSCELEKPCFTTEREKGSVTGDGDGGVQIKRLTEEDCLSGQSTNSSSLRMNLDMNSGPGFVGVSPFAARMACLDVKRATTSTFTSQGNEVNNQGPSFISEDEEEVDSSHIDSKSIIGKENIRSNGLFYSGSQSVSRMMSSRKEEGQALGAKDIFRCYRQRWNSFQDSHR